MTSTLYCLINKNDGSGYVNYGPAGRNELLSVEVNLGGAGIVGTADVKLRTAHLIPPMAEVQLFFSDAVTLGVQWIGGFAANPGATYLTGKKAQSSYRVVSLKVVDYNFLLDAMGLPYLDYVTDGTGPGATDFATQITRICRYICTGAYAADIINVNNPLSSTVSRIGQPGTGDTDKSWRQLLDDRMNAYAAANPGTKPTYYMGTTGVSSTRLGPQLEVFDASLLGAGGVLYTFHDGSGVHGTEIAIEGFRYPKDSSGQETYVRAWSQNSGFVNSADGRSSAHATYSNPYNQRSAPIGDTWMSKSYKVADGLTSGQVAAEQARILNNKKDPRTTIEVDVDGRLLTTLPVPGQKVAFTIAPEGLSDTVTYVAALKGQWRFNKPEYPLYTVTGGSRLLGLGESDPGGTGTVVERDTVPPNPPTSLSAVYTQIGDTIWVNARLSWTASTSGDVRYYHAIGAVGSAPINERTPEGNPVPTTLDILLRQGQTGTITLSAVDIAGNESTTGNPVITVGTSDTAPPPTDRWINGNFSSRDIDDPTLPMYHTRDISGGGTVAIQAGSTTHGVNDVKLQASATNQKMSLIGPFQTITNPAASADIGLFERMFAQVVFTPADAFATGVISFWVDWYSAVGVIISGGVVNSLSHIVLPGSAPSTLYSANILPPNGSVLAQPRIIWNTHGGYAGGSILVSNCRFELDIQASHFGLLNVETDPIKYGNSAGSQVLGLNATGGTAAKQTGELTLDTGAKVIGGGSTSLDAAFGLSLGYRELIADDTLLATDAQVLCDFITLGGNINITMPSLASVPAGKLYYLFVNDSHFNIFVLPDGLDLVQGVGATWGSNPGVPLIIVAGSTTWWVSELSIYHP